jgi:hypothetical protein
MSLSAVVRFEIGRRFRPGNVALPYLLFLGLHLLGTAWHLDSDGMFGYAFLSALGVGVRPGLREDASSGFARLLTVNLGRPMTLAMGRVASWSVWIVGLGIWAVVCTGLLPGGMGRSGPVHAAGFVLLGLLLLPLAGAMDRWWGLRMPLLSVYLLMVIAGLLLAGLGRDPGAIIAPLGLEARPTHGVDLWPLVLRLPFALTLAWLVCLEPSSSPRGGGRWPRPWRHTSGGRPPTIPRLALRPLGAMVESDPDPARNGLLSDASTSRRRDPTPSDLPRLGSSTPSPGHDPPPGLG